MVFLNILNDLKKEHSNNCTIRENGTILLEPNSIPKSRHMLFRPLDRKHIDTHLISEYENHFPEDYIDFLEYSNGANLYTVKLTVAGVSFAHPMFVIFGLPLTPSFQRPFDMEEPFDLMVEDLSRHKAVPKSWLKCGTYIRNYNFGITNDIFIDTVTNQVFACPKNQKDVVDSWLNLDVCFCDIYDSFADSKREYNIPNFG